MADLSDKGLKARRRKTAKSPTFECGNCGCKRYSECTCMKPQERKK